MKRSRSSRWCPRLRAGSLGIGLVLRQRRSEGRMLERMRLDAGDGRPGIKFELHAPGVGALRNETDVGDGRRVAVAIEARVPGEAEHLFQRVEADADPVPVPARNVVVAGTEF